MTATSSRDTCQQACQVELEMNEHFPHKASPLVVEFQGSTCALTRPRGCVREYVRRPDLTEQWTDLHANDGMVPSFEPQTIHCDMGENMVSTRCAGGSSHSEQQEQQRQLNGTSMVCLLYSSLPISFRLSN